MGTDASLLEGVTCGESQEEEQGQEVPAGSVQVTRLCVWVPCQQRGAEGHHTMKKKGERPSLEYMQEKDKVKEKMLGEGSGWSERADRWYERTNLQGTKEK